MRISDWSSDGCSSELVGIVGDRIEIRVIVDVAGGEAVFGRDALGLGAIAADEAGEAAVGAVREFGDDRSEEHTSELQSLMRISYAVFCLKKQINYTLKSREPKSSAT